MKYSAQQRDPPEAQQSRISSVQTFNTVFTGWVTSCEDLMSTPLVSSTSSTHHLQTGRSLVTPTDQSGTGGCLKRSSVSAGGTTWLSLAQHSRCTRFHCNSSSRYQIKDTFEKFAIQNMSATLLYDSDLQQMWQKWYFSTNMKKNRCLNNVGMDLKDLNKDINRTLFFFLFRSFISVETFCRQQSDCSLRHEI